MRLRRRRKTVEQDSRRALQEAKENLRRVQSRSDEVTEVTKSLRGLRERNHFAAKFELILEGTRNV